MTKKPQKIHKEIEQDVLEMVHRIKEHIKKEKRTIITTRYEFVINLWSVGESGMERVKYLLKRFCPHVSRKGK